MHAARDSHTKQLRGALHSWHRHHRRRVRAAEVLLAVDARRLHGTLVAWSRHVISCRAHTLRTLRQAWRILRGLHSVPPPLCLRTQDSATSVDIDSRFDTAALVAGSHSGRTDLTFDHSAFDARHPLARATGSIVLATQRPVTQLGASDPVRTRAASSAAASVGGHWLADDVLDTLPQPSAAPTTDPTHVHAITARAAADAAATALNNPMFEHVRADLYEIGIVYNDLSCCDVRMLKLQQRDDTFGRYAALHVTAHQLHCDAFAAEAAAKLTFDHLREPSTPTACMLHDDALSACKTAAHGATTSASPASSPLAQPTF